MSGHRSCNDDEMEEVSNLVISVTATGELDLNADGSDQHKDKPKKKRYKQRFKPEWLVGRDWLTNVDKQAYCNLCERLLCNDVTHLDRHAVSKKHLNRIRAKGSRQITIEGTVETNAELRRKEDIEKLTEKIEPVKLEESMSMASLEFIDENLYEKQMEFVQEYLSECSHSEANAGTEENRNVPNSSANKSEKAKAYRQKCLEEEKARAEIQYLQTKTAYLTCQMKNLSIERSLMLLQSRKLELEIEKLEKGSN